MIRLAIAGLFRFLGGWPECVESRVDPQTGVGGGLIAEGLYDVRMNTLGEHRVLIPTNRIASRIEELGAQITTDLNGARGAGVGKQAGASESGRLVLIPVLTGALVFVADLIRHIPLQMSIRPVTVSSYPGSATASQGANIHGGIPTDLGGAHVLLVDDILDSGRTLGLLKRMIAAQNPASLRLAVLLRKHKPGGRDEEVEVEYAGFDIEDEFVIGYGLDYDGLFRNLPHVAVMGT
ncbi:MAG: hypoxanthine phosphoribosyltransferase [Phycisphaeraceae bacterium]|nr:hypoxanthine phosphoribosyltransferase [Phycisphaeraceae bacterium]